MKARIILLSILVAIGGCAGSKSSSEARKIRFGVEAGPNSGGIVENTKMADIAGAPVDGFSGATSMGFHTGGHALLPVGRNDIQAGVMYLYSPQKFTYNDPVHGYAGSRDLRLSQVIVPVTYNFNLFTRKFIPGTLSLKVGGAIEYNMLSVTNNGLNLTDYSTNKISAGITLGIAAMPFRFSNNACLGFGFDMYKGGQIFDDFYNRPEFAMPSSSYMKFSVIYQFK
ncbi:MAG TPA: outer membrane beta-barrel protein [Bacteroidales bacterium]|nr:outer membrane beta-barrel protein [Bacteroidales bacterium]